MVHIEMRERRAKVSCSLSLPTSYKNSLRLIGFHFAFLFQNSREKIRAREGEERKEIFFEGELERESEQERRNMKKKLALLKNSKKSKVRSRECFRFRFLSLIVSQTFLFISTLEDVELSWRKTLEKADHTS